MADTVVQMDYSQIKQVSDAFNTEAETLRTVGQALNMAVQALRAMAFASMGTSLALANYLEGIEKAVENLAKVCEDNFAKPLVVAIQDHQNGDVKGKSYFGRPMNF